MLFVFQSGNAIDRPMFRMAKTVNVFATAHHTRASIAQMIKCGFSRISAIRYPDPLSSAGTVQRATNTPDTPQRDKERRKARSDKLDRNLGGAQPRSSGKAADHSEFMQGPGDQALLTKTRRAMPRIKTRSGNQNCSSDRMALTRKYRSVDCMTYCPNKELSVAVLTQKRQTQT